MYAEEERAVCRLVLLHGEKESGDYVVSYVFFFGYLLNE